MSKLVIEGGRRLEGVTYINGAKNAVLPVLAATLLNSGKNVIYDCPKLKDVYSSIKILEHLGCKTSWNGSTLTVDSSTVCEHYIPDDLMCEMRSSIIFLGALLARTKRARVTYPGGCELGLRPIDLHIKAFKDLGIDIYESHGRIMCKLNKIKCDTISLGFPSVGATENIMLVAALAEGTTVISNAAKEPEIVDLQNYLNGMGADISGAGTAEVTIHGASKLHDVEHRVISDRIETATFLAGAAITGGSIELLNTAPDDMQAVLAVLEDAGCKIICSSDKIELTAPKKLKGAGQIRTMPHPGFPTDAQPPIMAMLAVAEGVSIFTENMFDNRYKHISELNRMGANITTAGKCAVVCGVKRFSGAAVMSADLRAAAGLVVAGLNADGLTEVHGLDHLDRGYVDFEKRLVGLGANIVRVE